MSSVDVIGYLNQLSSLTLSKTVLLITLRYEIVSNYIEQIKYCTCFCKNAMFLSSAWCK